VTVTKDGCTIVGDGSTKLEVDARVKQINRLMEDAEAQYEIEKLSERVARLSGGVAVIQVRASSSHTHTPPPPPRKALSCLLQTPHINLALVGWFLLLAVLVVCVQSSSTELSSRYVPEDDTQPSPTLLARAVAQVGAQTETELKEKKLRVEDALNATKAAVDEGIVIGGGCTLLKLAAAVDDAFKATLDNDEQRVGADIIKRALPYSLRLIANNSGQNGSVVVDKVLNSSGGDADYGYNAATNTYENLMNAGIIDPTKVIRCALENSVSVAKTFLTSDVVVYEAPEDNVAATPSGGGAMDNSGYPM
jgi:chaperonin GroEL (HSP60 family)